MKKKPAALENLPAPSCGLRWVRQPGDFDALLASKPIVIVLFTADWCRPCHAQAAMLTGLVPLYEDRATFLIVDIAAASEDLLSRYFGRIKMLPTTLILVHGHIKKRLRGTTRRLAMMEMIEDAARTEAENRWDREG